ncbi:MAG: cytochrome c biogenesis CcdA family protein, partial [Nitriliruptoraceae bacterium]
MDIPIAFAFTAGLVATINPCGFAMLPAYLSYFMKVDDQPTASTAHNSVNALKVGAVVSAGFLAVFGLAGILITLGVNALIDALPWITIAIGIAIFALGIAMLTGREFRITLPKVGKAPSGRKYSGMFWFGVSYAIASLSCTLPVFLVVVAGAIPRLGFVAGVTTFLIYGLGMSTLLLLVTLSLAFGKQTLVRRLRRGSQHVNRIAGAILALAGIYIVFFWATTIAGDGTSQPAAVQWVEQLSSRATNAVASSPTLFGSFALAAVAVTVIASWLAIRRHKTDTGSSGDDPS